jgi:hypothetical protein
MEDSCWTIAEVVDSVMYGKLGTPDQQKKQAEVDARLAVRKTAIRRAEAELTRRRRRRKRGVVRPTQAPPDASNAILGDLFRRLEPDELVYQVIHFLRASERQDLRVQLAAALVELLEEPVLKLMLDALKGRTP